jgi:tetratricopeptide (TPR) repeat protein
MARVLAGLVLLLAACAGSGEFQPNVAEGQALFDEGDAYYAKGDYAKAIERYTLSIQANPEAPDPFYKRGKAKLKMIDSDPKVNYLEAIEQAIADFEIAVRIFPEFFEAYFARAVANASRARYKDAAFDLLHYCLKIRGQDKDAVLMLAKVYDAGFEGREAEAFKYYEKYVQLGGTDLQARQRYAELKGAIQASKAPDESEKKASELFESSMRLVGANQRTEGLRGLTELLQKYPNTQFVKDRQKLIAQLIEQLSTNRDKK